MLYYHHKIYFKAPILTQEQDVVTMTMISWYTLETPRMPVWSAAPISEALIRTSSRISCLNSHTGATISLPTTSAASGVRTQTALSTGREDPRGLRKLWASHHWQGRIQEFEKGGGTTYCFFRTAASLETRASPKRADKRGMGGGGGGGGDSDTFFRSAIYVGGGGSTNRGTTGGRNQTPFLFSFLFFRFQKGGHMYKKGGGGHL